jgi:hypothetical protein
MSFPKERPAVLGGQVVLRYPALLRNVEVDLVSSFGFTPLSFLTMLYFLPEGHSVYFAEGPVQKPNVLTDF